VICRISSRTTHADVLYDATVRSGNALLHRPLNEQVIDYWPALDNLSDQHNVWPAEDWIRYLEVPLMQWPDAVGPGGADDRAAVFHFSVRLHPADRIVTDADWATVIHRLAWTAGITTRSGEGAYRWMAMRTSPRQVEFVANLINDSDGTWAAVPRQLGQRMLGAVRDCENQLGLVRTAPDPALQPTDVTVRRDRGRGITVTVHAHRTQVTADVADAGFDVQDGTRHSLPAGTPTEEAERVAELVGTLRSRGVTILLDPAVRHGAGGEPGPDAVGTGTASLTWRIAQARQPAQLAGLISAVTDDRFGDLPRLRRFAETAAAWAAGRTSPGARDAQHRLEGIARRLHGVEEDLHGVAEMLTGPPAARGNAAVPLTRIAAPAPRLRGPLR
jgi:hypothetical protein